jgi:DNA-binding response OmpR family regulator
MVSDIQPDIVLVHEDSFCSDLRRDISLLQKDNKRIPVILVVSDQRKADAITAFHLNVADCVMYDIETTILVQRIQRSLTTLAPRKTKIPLGFSLYLPQASQILCHNEQRIDLLPKENELLSLLCRKKGEICRNEELTKALWGERIEKKKLPPSYWQMDLGSLVYKLRKRLQYLDYISIENLKKVGYRLLVTTN